MPTALARPSLSKNNLDVYWQSPWRHSGGKILRLAGADWGWLGLPGAGQAEVTQTLLELSLEEVYQVCGLIGLLYSHVITPDMMAWKPCASQPLFSILPTRHHSTSLQWICLF